MSVESVEVESFVGTLRTPGGKPGWLLNAILASLPTEA